MIRALLAWAALLTLTSCGGPPPPPGWHPTAEHAVTVPLVVAWRAARPLIEAHLNGQGPYLFVVDTGTAGGVISRPLAESLALPAVGDPARGARAVQADVALGPLTLTGARLAVVDLAEVGRLDERPVAGILGTHLLAGGALRLDPDAGTLTLYRSEPPPTPASATALPLTALPDGRLEVTAQVGPHTPALLVATGLPACALPPDGDAWAALQPPARGLPRVAPVGLGPTREPCAVFPGPASVGYAVLGQGPLQITTQPPRLARWPAAASGAHLRRYPDLPDCGAGFQGCLRGRIAVVEGRLQVRIERPQVALPDRYWLRINVGRPESPVGLLVKPGAAQAGPVQADARVPYLPDLMRPVGAAVDVVDVVPLARHCPGEVCLR
ncbi:MAG: aspartyl protease family protein [Myxococcales bacterium]|nr:aspartyl protease family protein [Myxococcales bacterium]MCB9525099.1 aspartyl protease family protein [Myxococcales bacterium]